MVARSATRDLGGQFVEQLRVRLGVDLALEVVACTDVIRETLKVLRI